ncbi:hypothetical protein RJ639_029368 [Escallonia herrerae]|uniref:Uncharacterized protein n=1 Tax=Escallonia herrerae TaxID=1293975 RepID=A0AA88X6E0_9ASTE|nr:hypothetical protein RJ639_029368 [Escallonia herrerae]
MVTVLEHCQISPPPGTVAENLFPLSFLDLGWLHSSPPQAVHFFDFPHPGAYFRQTVVPDLKASLSLTLKHFLPFAGKLILPIDPDSGWPRFRYADGDSVPVTFAECHTDYDDLAGNHARNANDFHPLVPQLPPAGRASDCIIAPVLAIQVTVFPNKGICVGMTNDHAACDASGILGFLRAWSSITQLGDDAAYVASGAVPLCDRTVIKDTKGIGASVWSEIGKMKYQQLPLPSLPSDQIRATFLFTRANIQGLKNLVLPSTKRVSSFVVACAYLWTCLAKETAASSTGEELRDENEVEHFSFPVDCRARLEPPLPEAYFGNCLVPCFSTAKVAQILGEDGFTTAVETIGEALKKRLDNGEEGLFKGAERGLAEFVEKIGQRIIGLAGSPKFDFYGIDFGWGKTKKYEIVSTNYTGAIQISGSKESSADLEIGLSFPKSKMDAFATIFEDGLKNII